MRRQLSGGHVRVSDSAGRVRGWRRTHVLGNERPHVHASSGRLLSGRAHDVPRDEALCRLFPDGRLHVPRNQLRCGRQLVFGQYVNHLQRRRQPMSPSGDVGVRHNEVLHGERADSRLLGAYVSWVSGGPWKHEQQERWFLKRPIGRGFIRDDHSRIWPDF